MRQAVIPFIFLLTGLLAGYFFQISTQPPEVREKSDSIVSEQELKELRSKSKKADELSEKLKKLSEINIEEYVTLKDQREKYLKADELFGKVMLLFLADLSLHMNKTVSDWANQTPDERRENFNEVFATSQPQIENYPTPTNESVSRLEGVPEFDDYQFQKEQQYNAKKPFKGRLGFQDKLGRNMKNMMDNRVVRELWGKEIWKGPTQKLQFDQLVFYEVRRKGLFRRGKKTQANLDFRLDIEEVKGSKKEFKTRLKISVKNSKRFYFHFDDKVEALHPKNHSKFGEGPCRGVILKGEKGILVYLSFLRNQSGKPDDKLIVGRLIDTRLKNPILGNFLLEKVE